MQRLKIDQDIRPMSEFRTGIASFLKQVHDTKKTFGHYSTWQRGCCATGCC